MELFKTLSGARGAGVLVGACALGLSVQAGAEIIYVRELELQGLATVEATEWDIGHKNHLFDRDWGNIYRTPSINPAIITVEFVEPKTVGAMRSLVAASPHDVRIVAADTRSDLENETGTFTVVLDSYTSPQEEIGWAEWNEEAVTGRFFRFIVERLQRDDFVHIRELELQTAEPVHTVTIGGQDVRINGLILEPDEAEVPVGSTLQLSAEAHLSYGPNRYDATGVVTWTSSNATVATMGPGGVLTAHAPGQATIRARIGPVMASLPVTVRERRPVDLSVGFIHRTPEYERFRVDFSSGDQVIHPDHVNQKMWPDPGEIVTYTAHCFNRGDEPAHDVDYVIRFNDEIVETGVISVMEPGERVEISWSAPWPEDAVQTVDVNPGAHEYLPPQFERGVGDHTIEFELDPHDKIEELSTLNNRVRDYITAMTFWFWVDESTYERLTRRANFIETFAPEDWFQLQLKALERKLWASGGRQRVRLDMVAIVEDGELNPGGTHEPWGEETRQADGRWGFSWPASYMDMFMKRIDHALVHELGHQIGMIDIYTYDIATHNMLISQNGQLVAGTNLMPLVSPWNVYYGMEHVVHQDGVAHVDWTGRGAMGSTGHRYFGPGTVAGMNRNLGLRRGFYGDYLSALPRGDYSLRVTRADGTPVNNASIRVFQRELNATVPNNPKFSGITGSDGEWVFPGQTLGGWRGGIPVDNPWSSVIDGQVFNGPHPVGSNAVLVVELTFTAGGSQHVEYHFVEVDRVNIAFNEGQTGDYMIDLMTYESRAAYDPPTISFSTPSHVTMNEGEELEVTVTASDPNGLPVALSATPIPNGEFDPETGVFTYRPDSLDVTRAGGFNEEHQVFFLADNGMLPYVRRLHITVDDVEGFAVLYDVVEEGEPCPADLAPPYGVIDIFDMLAYLDLFEAEEPIADIAPPYGVFDIFDVLAYLELFEAGCP